MQSMGFARSSLSLLSLFFLGCNASGEATSTGGSGNDSATATGTTTESAAASTMTNTMATATNQASSSSTTGGMIGIGSPPPTSGFNAGFTPNTISASTASSAFSAWKNRHVQSCGSTSRVDNGQGNTFSEGIGYGMLLAASHNDQALFDGLWAYYQANPHQTGLMNWEVSGCSNAPTSRGSGPASDADIDVAMALFMAACRFGSASYEQDALDLLDLIVLNEALQSGGLSLLKPGNWGGVNEINLSYYSPGYFRVFAYKHAVRTDYWDALANDTYELFARGTNPSTGLGPDWMTIDGAQSSQGRFTYYYDAARIPWRLAIDYLWYGTPEAKTYMDRIANFANGVGAGNIGDEYDLNGNQLSSNHNSTFVGGFATATMATDQSIANNFFSELANLPDSAYFEETLRALYLTLATGNFVPGC